MDSMDAYNLPHELKPQVFRLKRTGLEIGRLSFLDPTFTHLPSSVPHLRLCGTVSEVITGSNECATTCALRTLQPQNDSPICHTCGAGVVQYQSPVLVRGTVVGYVRGPELPSKDFYEQDLSRLDDLLRKDLLESRAAIESFDQHIVGRTVSRIARRLSRRCELEFRLKVLRHTRKRIVVSTTVHDVMEAAFLGLQALFGDVDICSYRLSERGNLELLKAKGPNHLLQPAILKPSEGQIGHAIRTQNWKYSGNLLVEPQGFVQVNNARPAQSALSVPFEWGAGQTRAALQISSPTLNAFGKPERQAAWAIADIAGLAGSRLELLQQRRITELKKVRRGSWADAMVDAIASPADTLVQILDTKRRLYHALVDEAKAICGAASSAYRVWDSVARLMRFAAFSETGWTEKAKEAVYTPLDNSAGMHAFEIKTPYHIPNVAIADHYKPVLPLTKSVYVIPIKSRGNVVALLSVDWNAIQPVVPHQASLLRLVRQFQGILAVLDSREDAIQFKLGRFAASAALSR